MSKPLLLSSGQGKVQELVGTATGQTVVWSEGPDEWVPALIPYDLPFELPGTPVLSTKVVNFEAVRAFILATTGHQGGQLTNPSGNFVCTVRKNATTLGTITFAAGGFSSSITGTLAERTFAAGDVLSVETQSTALGIDTPFATFFMTLV